MQRESNIELLRIIAMWFILVHHLIVHAVYPDVMTGKNGVTSEYAVCSLLEGFFYVAVNVFVLISGYFGIRLRARRIWSLYLQCAFYGLLTYLFGVLVGVVPFAPHIVITKSLLIFSHASSWWFVVCYLMLMILSPFLNYGMQKMGKKEYLFAIGCMAVLQIYLGWFWQKPAYDTQGYSLLNFIFMYMIGGYLHRYIQSDSRIVKRNVALSVYVVCSILFALENILKMYVHVPFGSVWAYNNPVMIVGAIGLVLFMRTFDFQSNIVNSVGGGVFAAYLITEVPYVGDFFYPHYGEFTQSIPSIVLILLVTLIAAAIVLLLACAIDIIRAWAMKLILGAFDWVDEWVGKSEKIVPKG